MVELQHSGPGRTTGDPRRWWVLGVLCLALAVVGIDGTIVNVALPTLVRELGATSSQLQWIVDAYTIVFAGFLLIAGNTGDRLGRKPVLIVGLVIFGAGSLACSQASTRGAGHRDAGRAGLRRRVHHAVDAVDPHERLRRRRRAPHGDRHLGRRVRPRRRDRAARRRLAARALLVGFDLPRQRPADRRGRRRDRRPGAQHAETRTPPPSTSSAPSCRRPG